MRRWARIFRDGDINKAVDQRVVCARGETALKNGQLEACTRPAEAFAQLVCAVADRSLFHPAIVKKLVPYMDATTKQPLVVSAPPPPLVHWVTFVELCGIVPRMWAFRPHF